MDIDIDLFSDDEGHPIPHVSICDIKGIKKTGGADLVIVIADTLKADSRSKQRLVQKIKNYIGLIRSEDFTNQAGASSIANTNIVVRINRDSDGEIFDLLERCRDWVFDNGASLVVLKI